MAVINDFIIFFPFRFGNLERDRPAKKFRQTRRGVRPSLAAAAREALPGARQPIRREDSTEGRRRIWAARRKKLAKTGGVGRELAPDTPGTRKKFSQAHPRKSAKSRSNNRAVNFPPPQRNAAKSSPEPRPKPQVLSTCNFSMAQLHDIRESQEFNAECAPAQTRLAPKKSPLTPRTMFYIVNTKLRPRS
jgi:hypothetical protein